MSCLSAAMLLLAQTPAYSAGLGKLSINSALGQPLNAEIEVIAADPTELSHLQARMASAEAFRNANIEMNNALSGVKFVVDKKADGHTVLKVTSNQPINDPFVDMLIELDWGSGQMVREYTLLLDPPGMFNNQSSRNLTVTPATVARDASATPKPASADTTRAAKPASRDMNVSQAKPVAKKPAPTSVMPKAESETPAAGAVGMETVGPIKRGATLIAIAKETKPEGVKLEQMLVGLYRQNTHAFAGNNMNRLKVGQIIKVPTKEEVSAISEAEAVREIKLQSADWHNYRQKLAGEVAAAPAVAEKPAQASGKITPKVEDRAAAVKPGQDVLKLSKGEAPVTNQKSANGVKTAKPTAAEQKQAAQDEAVAKQKALNEANERAAALEKNIKDMQRLVELKNQSMAALQKNAEKPAPAAPIPVPPTVKPEAAPAKPAEAVKKPVPVAQPKPAASVADTGNWYDVINPLYAGAAAVGVLLLALLGFMTKSRRRREGLTKFENSIMTNVEVKPNTVYGAQGGASVNTNNTSFLTDFSQSGLGNLDTHDVDPIAEAEVYMAYGRDAQAEEILKEAMVKDPVRHEIKLKLLEIYAARNNLPAFESIATELYSALGGENTPLWEKAAELGRKLDPNNPLYGGQPGAAVKHDAEVPAAVAAGGAVAAVALDEFVTADEPEETVTAQNVSPTSADQDMDFPTALDFDTELMPAPATGHEEETPVDADMTELQAVDTLPAEQMAAEANESEEDKATAEPVADTFAGLDFSLNFEPQEMPEAAEPVAVPEPVHEEPAMQAETVVHDDMLNFDFDLDKTDIDQHEELAPIAELAPAVEPADAPMNLDFSGINLNFDEPADAAETTLSDVEQEVKTKLDLAQVYQEMGDHENAREILQEVIKEGNAQQQASAQDLLNQLG
ncbi:FimV/HubP family polar landmark protein [Sulfuriferula sp. AH1]|uniref:FimV/HubP family polar landmark protein n=1 Tax=Sulfuriferula sp. AH1 TaxID=1985873 RepID=UPI0016793936|nr:FimV/HubP family polar landmark protein [Sulfuriferula sp. AH1]